MLLERLEGRKTALTYKRKKKRFSLVFGRIQALSLLILILTLLSGCKVKDKTEAKEDVETLQIYCLNAELDTLAYTKHERRAAADDLDGAIQECLSYLQADPGGDNVRLYPEEVRLKNYEVNHAILHLNFDPSYTRMDHAREVYARAGLTHTFLQLDGIDGICIDINGEAFEDDYGRPIGTQTLNSFVENYGESINTYQKVKMVLFFADETGKKLIPEEREVFYSTSVPLERAVVDEIIKGPKETGRYPVFPPTTNILSVVTQEGTCYVNFDKSADNATLSVNESIPLYAIVNALARNCKTEKVQFTIDGATDVLFRENQDLRKTYAEKKELIVEERGTEKDQQVSSSSV